MATERTTGLTYDDLVRMFPEDDQVLRELIGGELFVTPSPTTRHQRAQGEIFGRVWAYSKEHGGQAFNAPTAVSLSDEDFVEPDVLYIRPEHLGRVEVPFVRGAPDLVVEVSSSSTRRKDLTRKRDLYERYAVPEYWFVDLDSDEIRVYRLSGGRYGEPLLLGRGDTLESPLLPGFSVPVDEILGV